jgi:DNA-directed RNA polymerase specialized sigma24 family protein
VSLAFQEVLDRLDKFLWKMAHGHAKNLRGVDPEDLHQEGIIKMYELYSSMNVEEAAMEAFTKIWSRSVKNRFLDFYRNQKGERNRIVLEFDFEDASQFMGEDGFTELYLQHYKEHLQYYVSEEAALLLEHLLYPTAAILHEHNIQNMRRTHLKEQGHNTNLSRKISHQLAGKCLGFSVKKTRLLICELQSTWKELRCHRPNWPLNAVSC